MYVITQVTVAVVIVNLLHQLDIPRDRLIYALTTSGRLTRAARLAREQWPVAAAEHADGVDCQTREMP